MYYYIYLKAKPEDDRNGIENFMYEKMVAKDGSFFPLDRCGRVERLEHEAEQALRLQGADEGAGATARGGVTARGTAGDGGIDGAAVDAELHKTLDSIERRSDMSFAMLQEQSKLVDTFAQNTDTAIREMQEDMAKQLPQVALPWLRHADIKMKAMPEVVMAAVEENGLSLEFADYELIRDEPIVSAAVLQNGLALQFAASEMKEIRALALKAVKQNGMALRYCHQELRDARMVVLAAVTQNGHALRFASRKMQADEEVVLAAVGQCGGHALEYAAANHEDAFRETLSKKLVEFVRDSRSQSATRTPSEIEREAGQHLKAGMGNML